MAVATEQMNKRIFPIKVEPACLLKWSWSSVYFSSGITSSCHRTEKYRIDPNNFNNFHNVPEKIRDREMMLNGQWPGHGCEYCRNVESAGGVSDRQYQLELQGSLCQHPPELNVNPAATSVTPTILEVWFTNTCNMSCVYCDPYYSSQWADENRKFNKSIADPDISKIFVDQRRFDDENPQYDQMVNNLWSYLIENDRYLTLRRFHILGGEPFLLKELDQVIEFWDKHGNMNLVLNIVSNLNIPHERFKKYIDKFEKLFHEKKIWKLQLTASLDAWGPVQEYTRFGLDLNLWRENFELLVSKQWITLSINSTISGLAFKQLPLLFEKMNEWNACRGPEITTDDHVIGEPIHYSFNTSGFIDSPYNFGPDVFKDSFEEILSLMPTNTGLEKSTKEQIASVIQAVQKSTKNVDKLRLLKGYLTELDRRRGTNWQVTFPWLVDL